MSPVHATLVCLLSLASLAVAAQDICSSAYCTSNVNCVGFAYNQCFNSSNSNMMYTGAVCYSATACANYSSTSGDLTITLGGAAPSLIYNYYSVIKTAVMNAYNNYCKSSNNYMICCPGAVSWPTKSADAITKTAMSSTDEVLIPSATGTASSTVLVIRLAPNQNSLMCSAVTYTTTTVNTTATTAAASSSISSSNATTTTSASTASTTTGPTTTAGSTTTGSTTTAGSTTTTGPTTTTGSTTTAGSTTTTGPTTTTGSTTTAGSTTTTGPTTITGPTTSGPSTTTGAIGRRKREVAIEAIRAENEKDSSDMALHRQKRVAMVTISLPANTVASIASSICIAAVIQTALSTSANIMVTVTVSTVGSTVSSCNVASQLQGSRLMISSTALVAFMAFSLRRST